MKDVIREIIREEMIRNKKTYYFMSGLPRSGSTLLSAILNQNPRFYSGPSSPVVSTMITLEQSLSNDELYLAYPKQQQASDTLSKRKVLKGDSHPQSKLTEKDVKNIKKQFAKILKQRNGKSKGIATIINKDYPYVTLPSIINAIKK